MKKKALILTALSGLLLTGCKITLFGRTFKFFEKKESNTIDQKIVVPTGAPAIAMSAFAMTKNFETVTDPSTIVPMMASGQVDVAVLPTNVGATAITIKQVPFKILCTITFGNFYLASTGHDDDGIMDRDDYIVSFQKGAVPDKIFHYIHGDEFDNALHYVSGAADAAKCLKTGKNMSDENAAVDYVLLAEPAMTNVLKTTPTASVYEDLQSKYKEKSGGLLLPQASVFVKSSLDQETVMEGIYEALSKSVDEMVADTKVMTTLMNMVSDPETVFGVKPEVAAEVTQNGNKMGLGCKLASTIKNDINNFLQIFGVSELKDENIA